MKYLQFFKKICDSTFFIKNDNLLGIKNSQTPLGDDNTFKQKSTSRLKQNVIATESGRSMIEMIGVLALIGLLSIGGIMGFRYTLNSHRAGQIQDIVSQSKVLAVTKKAAGENNLETFLKKTQVKNNEAVVDIAESMNETGRKQYIYTITLDTVPDDLQAAIYMRKQNFAKMDILVLPSEDAIDDIENTWVADGMKPEIYELLSTAVPLQTESKITFAFVIYGRGNRTHTDEGEEPEPSACPTDQFYDEATDSCVYCDPSDPSLHWDPALNKCVACTGAKTQWDNVLHACICPTGTYGESCITCDAGFTWDEATEKCVECVDNTDCTDPTKPVCSAGVCAGCPGGKIWNTGTKQCVECIDNSDCTDPTKPVCSTGVCAGCPGGKIWNTGTKQCVECIDNSDCTDPTKPVCSTGVCASCPGGKIWNTGTKQCVECIDHSDCTDPTKPVCSTGVCASCPDGKIWDTETKQCVECLSNSDCPLAEKGYCNRETKQCEICGGRCFTISYNVRYECPDPEVDPGSAEPQCSANFRLYAIDKPTEGTYQIYAFDLDGNLVWVHSTPIQINKEIQLDMPPGTYRFMCIYNTPGQNNGVEFDDLISDGREVVFWDAVHESNTHGLTLLETELPDVDCP